MHLTVASELGPAKFAAWHRYKQAIRGSHLVHPKRHLNKLTKITVGHVNNWLNHYSSLFSAVSFTSSPFFSLLPSVLLSQVSVVNALDMQVVVSNVPPTLVEEKKEELIKYDIQHD